MDRLVDLGDVNFKPFELKIGKNMDAIKGKFEAFGTSVKGNYAEIGQSLKDISNNYTAYAEKSTAESARLTEDIKGDWADLSTDAQTSMDKFTKSMDE